MMETFGVAGQMVVILGAMLAMVAGLIVLQEPMTIQTKDKTTTATGRYLPDPQRQPSKLAFELFVSAYTPVWMFLFGIIVVFQLYEDFDAWSYLKVCGGLSLPFLLQPIVLPSAGFHSPDANRPLLERYSFKANVWIAVYSFIGNYWYTHCKYKEVKYNNSTVYTAVYPVEQCIHFLYLHIYLLAHTYSFLFSMTHTKIHHPSVICTQTFIQYSRHNIPCRHTDSTMSLLPCSLQHIFTFNPTTCFPMHCFEKLSQPIRQDSAEPSYILPL